MPAVETLHFVQNVPPTEEKFLSMHFAEKIKQKVTSRKLKWSERKCIIIEAIKPEFIKYQEREKANKDEVS